ncbi:MAG: hypothetical protein U0105_21000 [Candidatus Obscuribacterales bacterium]
MQLAPLVAVICYDLDARLMNMQLRQHIPAFMVLFIGITSIPSASAYDEKLWDYINNNQHVSQKVVDGMRARGQQQKKTTAPRAVTAARTASPAKVATSTRQAAKKPLVATASKHRQRTVAAARRKRYIAQTPRSKKRGLIARFFSALKHVF